MLGATGQSIDGLRGFPPGVIPPNLFIEKRFDHHPAKRDRLPAWAGPAGNASRSWCTGFRVREPAWHRTRSASSSSYEGWSSLSSLSVLLAGLASPRLGVSEGRPGALEDLPSQRGPSTHSEMSKTWL